MKIFQEIQEFKKECVQGLLGNVLNQLQADDRKLHTWFKISSICLRSLGYAS